MGDTSWAVCWRSSELKKYHEQEKKQIYLKNILS